MRTIRSTHADPEGDIADQKFEPGEAKAEVLNRQPRSICCWMRQGLQTSSGLPAFFQT